MYINTLTNQYPVSEQDIRMTLSNVSFPAIFEAPENYKFVFPSPEPEYNPITHYVKENVPILTNKGTWEQQWQIVNRYNNQADEDAAVLIAQQLKNATIKADIIKETQLRLDEFAQTRGYDNILSACTYATSPTLKFAAEGQYCVAQRDATWAKLLEILAEIESGIRLIPANYAAIENELPLLQWPS